MRGLYRRRGSPNWWVRYADPNGRIIRESTGTSEKTLAKKVLAKKRVLVIEGRHLDKKQVPRTGRPSSSCASSIGNCGASTNG